MHRKASKRRQRAQLTFVYFVMTMAVIASVSVFVLATLGYRFNRSDGKVEQGGLVQFDSRPTGATVMLDTIQLANKTPSKLTVSSGAHTITIKKDGYNQWRKDVIVKPGAVLWLNYARMLPTKPTTTEAARLKGATSAVASTDKKWLALVEVAAEPTITVTDLNADTPTVTKVTIATGEFAASTDSAVHSFSVQGWDSDNRYVLVKHTVAEKTEYLLVDSRGEQPARNLSTLFAVDAKSMVYDKESSNVLYALTASHELRQIDLSARTLSPPLLTNISSFTQFNRSTLTYETLLDANQQRHVGYFTLGSTKPHVVRSVTDDGTVSFKFRLGRYYNVTYALINYSDQTEVLSGEIPASDSATAPSLKRVVTLSTPSGASALGFSPGNNRFAYAQQTATTTTFDLELLSAARISQPVSTQPEVNWIDNYHISSSAAGVASIADFDGTNLQSVAASNVVDLPVVMSANSKYLYVVTAKDGATSLTRVDLLTS